MKSSTATHVETGRGLRPSGLPLTNEPSMPITERQTFFEYELCAALPSSLLGLYSALGLYYVLSVQGILPPTE